MKLFRIGENKEIDIINESSYRNTEAGNFGESTLQELLIDNPELLPSEEIDSSDPPKFLVLRSEAGVTSGSIDILLVDHKGVPTVVETKLIDNREIRRSVLAQGVEYLAHLKTEWSAERMLDEAKIFWQGRKMNFDAESNRRLGFSFDSEFLERISGNIQSNRMRLIIASDEIPPELKRIVEFLNDACDFDIFGVEVKLFTAKDNKHRILAPRLIGQTEESKERKSRVAGSRWNYERFIETIKENNNPDDPALTEELMKFGREVSGQEVEWGMGKERGSFTARLVMDSHRFSLFSVYTTSELGINIGWSYSKYDDLGLDISERYRSRVANELGVDFTQSSWERAWPMVELSRVFPNKREAFKQLIRDFVSEIKTVLAG